MYPSTKVDVLRPHFHPVPPCNLLLLQRRRVSGGLHGPEGVLALGTQVPPASRSVLGRSFTPALVSQSPWSGLPAQLNCNPIPIQSQVHHHFPSLPWLAHGIFFPSLSPSPITILVLSRPCIGSTKTIFDSLLSFIPCLDSHDQSFEFPQSPAYETTTLPNGPSIILQPQLPPT